MKIGIVGHAAEKFTPETKAKAFDIIRQILADHSPSNTMVVSGRSPMGGVDVWAELVAEDLGIAKEIYPARVNSWPGFKERNMQIARASDVVHVIVVRSFPPGFKWKRFPWCYHCGTAEHVKSGACWTANKAILMGKRAEWHLI